MLPFSPEPTAYELALWQNHTFFLSQESKSEMTAHCAAYGKIA
jgi:hypothetical protein